MFSDVTGTVFSQQPKNNKESCEMLKVYIPFLTDIFNM